MGCGSIQLLDGDIIMTIDDLVFKPHPMRKDGKIAQVSFNNGYGASIITGNLFYTSENAPYELGVLKDGSLTYDTPITDDVLGYLTADDVDRILSEIEALPEPPTE